MKKVDCSSVDVRIVVGQYRDGVEIRITWEASSHLLGLRKQRPGHVGYLGNMMEDKDNYSMRQPRAGVDCGLIGEVMSTRVSQDSHE